MTGPAVLATKLQPPLQRPGLVPRPQLLDALRRSADTRVTLICGPAGAGKTTLLAEWAADPEERRTLGWLSLDHGDSDEGQFWTYAAEALRRMRPDLIEPVVPAGPVAPDAVATELLPAIVNALSEEEERHVLVLDDLHLIEGREVFEGLEFLIEALPPSLHLVLASRVEPPLPLARWRTRRELTEIGASDLYLDLEESSDLLEAAGVSFEESEVSRLFEWTEGWPAGLYLAALSMREGAYGPGELGFRDDSGDIGAFLLPEVLDNLSGEDREFLLKTSIATRLSGGFCDAILERTGSAETLERIARANLFLVPLDRKLHEYRYHHLFGQLLEARLEESEPEALPGLHRRAADWQLQHGEAVEAFSHLNRAGETSQAGELLVKLLAEDLAPNGRLGTFVGLLAELPDGVLDDDPRLLITSAWAEWSGGHYDRLGSELDLLERLHDVDSVEMDTAHSFSGSFKALQAMWLFRGRSDLEAAIELARPLPAGEPDPALPSYWFVRGCLAELQALGGETESLIGWLARDLEEIPDSREHAPSRGALAAWLALAWSDRLEGIPPADRAPGMAAVRTAAAAAEGHPDPNGIERFLARLALGRVALLAGDHAAAETGLSSALATPRYWHNPDLLYFATVALAEARQRQGRPGPARELYESAAELVEEEPVAPRTRDSLGEVARRIRLGTLERQGRAAASVDPLSDRELQILQLLGGDLTQREIGAEIHLSFNTVKGYSKSLYRKLGVSSRSAAVERGRELALI